MHFPPNLCQIVERWAPGRWSPQYNKPSDLKISPVKLSQWTLQLMSQQMLPLMFMLQATICYKLPGDYWEQLISTFKNNTRPKCSQAAVWGRGKESTCTFYSQPCCPPSHNIHPNVGRKYDHTAVIELVYSRLRPTTEASLQCDIIYDGCLHGTQDVFQWAHQVATLLWAS